MPLLSGLKREGLLCLGEKKRIEEKKIEARDKKQETRSEMIIVS
ncbi:hypothetical protein FLJC2902T_12490 [Flavobacterium limnosediminis JC2902]|uniref:Uncharacterized protein n=1 Tax=Flavobacterium limnosediminis JC2902 TaxID=1341181 RepID=V6SPQ9_9FLAO|nr:hypothetical protein FLJC2902T_12490 [Flavobacterium limnosediminis JC2902]